MNLFEGNGFKNPIEILQSERLSYPDIDSYIKSLSIRHAVSPWLKFINDMGIMVEPVDRVMGMDPDRPSAKAFIKGALLGFHVIRLCTPKDVSQRMQYASIGRDSEDPDHLQRVHDISSSLIDEGERGLADAPDLAELIESWESEITPDVRFQPFVRRGFGVMMRLLSHIIEEVTEEQHQKELAAMEQATVNGVDWDSEFRNLTSS